MNQSVITKATCGFIMLFLWIVTPICAQKTDNMTPSQLTDLGNAYYAGKKIADLDPHEILYAMAENRLMFVSEGDKELFVSILLEKLKDDEKLTRFMNILGNVAIGIAVATALIVAGVFAGKKALKANDGQ